MRTFVKFPIHLYKYVFYPLIKQVFGIQSMCRFQPTCSDYALEQIEKCGIMKGSWMSVMRILHCHPFSKTYGQSL